MENNWKLRCVCVKFKKNYCFLLVVLKTLVQELLQHSWERCVLYQSWPLFWAYRPWDRQPRQCRCELSSCASHHLIFRRVLHVKPVYSSSPWTWMCCSLAGSALLRGSSKNLLKQARLVSFWFFYTYMAVEDPESFTAGQETLLLLIHQYFCSQLKQIPFVMYWFPAWVTFSVLCRVDTLAKSGIQRNHLRD